LTVLFNTALIVPWPDPQLKIVRDAGAARLDLPLSESAGRMIAGGLGSVFVVIPTGSYANLVVSGLVDEAVLVRDASRPIAKSSLKERAVSRPWRPQIWAVFDRGAHAEVGVGVKARAEPDRVAAGGP
jgi:hypothetical protein